MQQDFEAIVKAINISPYYQDEWILWLTIYFSYAILNAKRG